MDINTIVSESYNQAIETGFNDYLEKHATAENTEIKLDEDALVSEVETKWLDTMLPETGMTPREYIKSLASLDQLAEFFIKIAEVSDVGVPDLLIDRLNEYGKAAADKLFAFVKTALTSKDTESYQAVPQAVYAIGCMRFEEYKEKLIELLIESCQNDIIAEAIRAAIVEYDKEIVGDLIRTFKATSQDTAREYLLTCVAEISKENKSDEVFYFLKDAFRVLSNMKLAVEVLGDYGDGRAIPLLRGYILRNIKDMDKNTFNHVRAAIKKLGGEINDLVYPVK